ncbi:hypothetical protein FA15DRAFT_760454 [Coprinopsis marcescibilis]|uniref:Uncharacterized protein n=1 Tax=Coprinopsis marcescibilis TaxID=230819 RepID=A0A5C3KFI1_COPMA|nr:hypothetical protein FA15DRAFT_760454 [Coprinopsis marcescibilis]
MSVVVINLNPGVIIIDNEDPSIKYTGDWTIDTNQFGQWNVGGQLYRGSQHTTSTAGASFSFDFTASWIKVYGTVIPTTRDTPIPYRCEIDGVIQHHRLIPANYTRNHEILCSSSDYTHQGSRTLTITLVNGTVPLFIDYIELPGPSITSEEPSYGTIRWDWDDGRIRYTPRGAWGGNRLGAGSLTRTNGAKATIPFTGTRITALGRIYREDFPSINATATYSIDRQEPIEFVVPAYPSSNELPVADGHPLAKQLLFQTEKFYTGEHEITIEYRGSNTTAPLALEYIYVDNNAGFKQPVPVAAIAGGVVGGFIFLVLLFMVCVYLRRRRRQGVAIPSEAKR